MRPDLVIGADTVVVVDGKILEKPADKAEARAMLRSLSGRQHEVHTGVALLLSRQRRPSPAPDAGGKQADLGVAAEEGARPGVFRISTFSVCTQVAFCDLPEDAIEAYIETDEPFDKAGGYGIQGHAACFITGIEGCYYNVMGFPLHAFCAALKHMLDEERSARR